MAQQIQFIYLTQSEYDALNPKNFGKIYFTSDTHRIYKGSDLYAATTFDQLNFSAISASSITVDGSAVALEGHTHSEYASVGHTHSEITPIEFITASAYSALASKDSGTIYFVDDNSIYKGSELYGAATFDQLNFSVIEATSLTVQGNAVALEGHTHSMADVSGLGTELSGFASSGHTHSELNGITSTSITKDMGTFTNLVVANASITATSIVASGAEINGSLSANTVTASTGTFNTVTTSDLNLTNLTIASASASSMTVQNLSVTGSMLYNSKEVATQEYVQQMISLAIGQALASEY